MRQHLIAFFVVLALAQTASANGGTPCPVVSSTMMFNTTPTCEPPPPTNPGTGTPGYWKNHPEAWPVKSLMVGNIVYSQAQLLAILGRPTSRDVTYIMARALIAALLNGLIGNDTSCIDAVVDDAQLWLVQHPIGSGVRGSSPAWFAGSAIASTLDDYNKGLDCAPHRDD